MRRRFGLHFEVMTRAFIAHRRRQRGFGVNPWATHHRFIISHALLRRPEYRESLLQLLRDRATKSLLVLDEAHAAAPASRSRYAVDSEVTSTIRDLAPRFDNRLFLSATPHNGHSNSFSALLEILDPIRFTRGVPVDGKADLAPITVRRLKRDLKKPGIESVPDRIVGGGTSRASLKLNPLQPGDVR
jgi:superfamily II DNA or RNA helicase